MLELLYLLNNLHAVVNQNNFILILCLTFYFIELYALRKDII